VGGLWVPPFDLAQGGPSRSTMLTALSPSKGMVEGPRSTFYFLRYAFPHVPFFLSPFSPLGLPWFGFVLRAKGTAFSLQLLSLFLDGLLEFNNAR